jgi:hypothetical protein
MERQILTLLRRVERVDVLAASPLMQAICDATATPNPREALELVVGRALCDSDPATAPLRASIVEADFARHGGNAVLAARNGISRRHFQRRRALAVAAVARYVRMLVPRADCPPAGSVEAGRTNRPVREDLGWRFRRELAAYAHVRDRGSALEMRSIATNLRRLAASSRSRALAVTLTAEADAHLGKAAAAVERLGELPSAAGALVRAKLALLAMDLDSADSNASSALAAATGAQRYRCHEVISQVRLLQRSPWRPPCGAAALSPHSREGIAMGVEAARHHLREGRSRDGEIAARFARRQAETYGFSRLAARSMAVLSCAAFARGATVLARWWRVRAIEMMLPTQDRLLATGLFTPDPLGLDRELIAALVARLCVIVPQLLADDEAQRGALCLLVEAILEADESTEQAERLERAIRVVARSGSVFADYIEASVEPVAEMLALALTALRGCSWSRAFDVVREPLAASAASLRPNRPRTIAIPIPRRAESQPRRIEHLRNDENTSDRERSSVEALTDLRIRRLSFRSGARSALARKRGDSVTRAAQAALGLADPRER